MIRKLVVLGGTGDLARRLLLPALAELEQRGLTPAELSVIAVGRKARSTADYREEMARALDEHARGVATSAREATIARLSFARADATAADELRPLVREGGPVAVYLALPPAVMEEAVRALAGAGLPGGSRVVVEKPLGEDLASARSLNAALGERFADDDVFRIDHFLGLYTLREFAQRRATDDTFDALLRRECVARVEIVWDERLTVEARAGFYDSTGALRDVLQNHLLQVLALVAMDRPGSAAACDLRRAKTAVLAAVRCPPPAEAPVVRARYGEGTIDGRRVRAYAEEDDVDPARGTETFVALTLYVDSERWRGVPFVLRTGKALAADRHELRVLLRDGACEAPADCADLLRVPLDDAPPGGAALSAYGQVLRSIFAGEPDASIGALEAELSWRIVEPYLELFAAGEVPLREYPAGSRGPEEPEGR